MFTRGSVSHDYTPSFPKRVRTPAVMAVRPMGVAGPGKNVTGVVPVSRPNSSPSPDQGAPFYSAESYDTAAVQFIYGGVMPLHMPRAGVEADLTDPNTWQRPYRFTEQ